MQVAPSSTRSATRTPGSAPCRAAIPGRAAGRIHRGADRPAVLAPPAATSLSARQTVGTDATGPNSSRWSSSARGDPQPLQPAGNVHLASAPPIWLDKGFDTHILPGQEHFPYNARWSGQALMNS